MIKIDDMKNRYLNLGVILLLFFTSCSDDLEVRIPRPTNITLNELKLDKDFTHNVPDGGFTSQGIHFNTVKASNGQLEAGFCYSNRSQRSFVWKNDETSMDSVRYSVWTTRPNDTDVYAVCRVKGDDAYFTLETPSVIQYILVSNTTWGYLAAKYGDTFETYDKETGELNSINPNIPSKPVGIWHSFVPGGVKKMVNEDKDYFRLKAKGFSGGKETGNVTFDLACLEANTANPKWSYVVADWTRFDLASLGTVDKVVFYLDSSDKDANGNMRTPAWFCLDGIQLENK